MEIMYKTKMYKKNKWEDRKIFHLHDESLSTPLEIVPLETVPST
jgi:hypothetical protein